MKSNSSQADLLFLRISCKRVEKLIAKTTIAKITVDTQYWSQYTLHFCMTGEIRSASNFPTLNGSLKTCRWRATKHAPCGSYAVHGCHRQCVAKGSSARPHIVNGRRRRTRRGRKPAANKSISRVLNDTDISINH